MKNTLGGSLAVLLTLAATAHGGEKHVVFPKPSKIVTPRTPAGYADIGTGKGWRVWRMGIKGTSKDAKGVIRIVILGDGYAPSGKDAKAVEAEAQRFLGHSKTMARRIETDPAGLVMLSRRGFEFTFLFKPSKQSVSPSGQKRDTVFKSFTSDHRLNVGDEKAVEEAVNVISPGRKPDVVVVMTRMEGSDQGPAAARANANTPWQSGASRVRLPCGDPDAFVHELLHAIFGLGDEYSGDSATPSFEQKDSFKRCPNTSDDPACARWRYWSADRFESGWGASKGVWHPFKSCVMNECVGELCKYCRAYVTYHFDVEERKDAETRDLFALTLLHPAASKDPKKVGEPVLLFTHKQVGEPHGVIETKHRHSVELTWCVAGLLPGKWTLEVVAYGDKTERVFSIDVHGTQSHFTLPGLPVIVDAQGLPILPVGNGHSLRGYYAIYATPTDQPNARYLRGVIRVFTNSSDGEI